MAWEVPHCLQWDTGPQGVHGCGVVPRKGPGVTTWRCGNQTKILLHGFLCFSMEIQVRITQDTACPFGLACAARSCTGEAFSLSPPAASPCHSSCAGEPFTLTDMGTWEECPSAAVGCWPELPGECCPFCRLVGVCQQLQEGLGAWTPGQQEKRVPAATTGATKGVWLGPLTAWGWPTPSLHAESLWHCSSWCCSPQQSLHIRQGAAPACHSGYRNWVWFLQILYNIYIYNIVQYMLHM